MDTETGFQTNEIVEEGGKLGDWKPITEHHRTGSNPIERMVEKIKTANDVAHGFARNVNRAFGKNKDFEEGGLVDTWGCPKMSG